MRHTSNKDIKHGEHVGTNQSIKKSQEQNKVFGDEEQKRDVVEETSWESMDCSDPPSTY